MPNRDGRPGGMNLRNRNARGIPRRERHRAEVQGVDYGGASNDAKPKRGTVAVDHKEPGSLVQMESVRRLAAKAIAPKRATPPQHLPNRRLYVTRHSQQQEDVEITEPCVPSMADCRWTERQEKALLRSLSAIKPGVNFWRLIAERVPGRSAEECFRKFYSGRTTTRAARRFRTDEVNSVVAERNSNECVRSLQCNMTPMNARTSGRKTRASAQDAAGPDKEETKMRSKERNAGAATRQMVVTPGGAKRWKIEGARETRASVQAVARPAKEENKLLARGRNAGTATRQMVVTPGERKKIEGARETRASAQAPEGPAKEENNILGKGLYAGAATRQMVVTPGGAKRRKIEGARETRASAQAAARPLSEEKKILSKGLNGGAATRQVAVTHRGAKCRKIEGASNSPEVKQINVTKPGNVEKATDGQRSQGLKNVSRDRIGRHSCIEKPQVRPSTSGVTLATGFDQTSASEGDKKLGGSLDDNGLWTNVQEAALQDAYSTVRPSASFWHHISKRVPGRSAEECFNKFYAGHPTPPRVAQRSCLKAVDCPPSVPSRPKAKNTGGKRLLEAQRTVRDSLRRQQVDNEDYEADAFAALEPPDVVHSVMEKAKDDEGATVDEPDMRFCISGPVPRRTENSITKFEQADKENWKPKAGGQSRGFGISQSNVRSPEVLKKVKNPLMLDKYIDQLHQRRTRRIGSKPAQKNAKWASGLIEHSNDGLDFREIRLDAIHRAKQELRDVFLRPASAVEEPLLALVDDLTDDEEHEDEVD